MKTVLRSTVFAVCVVALIASTRLLAQATNVTGEWAFNVQTDQGGGTPTITFKQDGEKLTGNYAGQLGNADLTGTVKGNAIHFTFTLDVQGQQAPGYRIENISVKRRDRASPNVLLLDKAPQSAKGNDDDV